MSAEIHTTASTISEQAAESTFHEVDDRERAIPAIEFRNVVLAFDDRIILNNLSFKVMKGETKIILGGSGGGKSTIIKLVLGLLKPDEGQVLVEGEDVTNYSEDQMMKVRKNIGMVFQEGALFDSLSVYDNVAFRLHEQGVPEDEVEPEVRRAEPVHPEDLAAAQAQNAVADANAPNRVDIKPLRKTYMRVTIDDDPTKPAFERWVSPSDGTVEFRGHHFSVTVLDRDAVQIRKNGKIVSNSDTDLRITAQ